MTVYGSEDIAPLLEPFARSEAPYGVSVRIVRAFEAFEAAGGYSITPLRAAHGTGHPFNYLIENNGKTLLYAHDTGKFRDDTYEYLRGKGITIDMISADCNEGTGRSDCAVHMNMEACASLRSRMTNDGIINPDTLFVLNHFSHNGENCLYDDMVKLAAEGGMLVSYDGMTLEF